MRFLDIIGMSASNLWRRKLRTFLTVLGVLIGTTSIVVMISLGIGLKAAVMAEFAAYGSMNEIQLYNYSYGGNNGNPLTDSTLNSFYDIPHVTNVSPILTMSAQLLQGKYACYTEIQGVSREYMEKITIGEGSLPDPDSNQVELVIGNAVIQDFYVTSTYKYPYYENNELADVDFMGKTLFTQLESTYDENGVETKGKKNIFPVAGIVAGGTDSWNQYSYGVYVDIDALKAYLKKTYRGKLIPGQPTDKKGKPMKEICYNRAIVAVDDSANVSDVVSTLSDMGYQAYSESEWIKQAEQEMLIIQAVLGGIGAVALLVAAIGIANTMMMSTYERTKEIGVMKVLGCSLGNIRALFLTEAAFIGFLGGLVGLLLSMGISSVCNSVLPMAMGYGEGVKISLIPWWLALVAVVFAAFIGIVAGFFPAQRATKLSPLAAIRNE